MDIPDSLMAAEYAICRVRMVRFGIVRKIIVLVVGQAVPVGYREASQAIDCNTSGSLVHFIWLSSKIIEYNFPKLRVRIVSASDYVNGIMDH
jgi:hypothetical protein